jgi:hypothetical protein
MIIHLTIKNLVLVLISLIALSCSDYSLTEYTAKNSEEEKIIELLIKFNEAKINCDLDSYLHCLHENGKFQFGERIVHKSELKKRLPDFWAGLKSVNPSSYPINRESITGDYIIAGRFINPKIIIVGDTADVTVAFTKWGWRRKQYISMIRENDQWRISDSEWQPN